jgi:hypothetical protein
MLEDEPLEVLSKYCMTSLSENRRDDSIKPLTDGPTPCLMPVGIDKELFASTFRIHNTLKLMGSQAV